MKWIKCTKPALIHLNHISSTLIRQSQQFLHEQVNKHCKVSTIYSVYLFPFLQYVKNAIHTIVVVHQKTYTLSGKQTKQQQTAFSVSFQYIKKRHRNQTKANVDLFHTWWPYQNAWSPLRSQTNGFSFQSVFCRCQMYMRRRGAENNISLIFFRFFVFLVLWISSCCTLHFFCCCCVKTCNDRTFVRWPNFLVK